jgi:hypothetical protein
LELGKIVFKLKNRRTYLQGGRCLNMQKELIFQEIEDLKKTVVLPDASVKKNIS